jgi:adenylate kinase
MKKKVIVLLGLPGCGKGTQAAIVAEKFSITSYSIGEILRSYAAGKYENSSEVKNIIDKGQIVPGSLVNDIVNNILKDAPKVCILDGYPRNLDQAQFLATDSSIDVVPIYFYVNRQSLEERIQNRVQCRDCDKIYSAKNLDLNHFKCDNCGFLEYYSRSDDNLDVLTNRINQFEINTIPVVDYYEKLGMLRQIDASQSVEQVSANLRQLILNLDIDFQQ